MLQKNTGASGKINEKECFGEITHYFPKVNAAVIKIQKTLSVGEKVEIKGVKTSFKQKVHSLQINRIPVEEGRAGEDVGMEVKNAVSVGDRIYKA